MLHNINWNPYGGKIINKDYHYLKTLHASDKGFRVINIWDWDNIDKIISSLSRDKIVYGRKCVIKEVSKKDAREFLNLYHFQSNCNG